MGRWDLTVASPSGALPSWLGVVEKGGQLEVWYQPPTANVYQLKDFKASGSHLTIACPGRGEPAGVTWELDVAGDKLTGVQKRGENASAITGVRAPDLKRAARAWTNPEPLFDGKDLTGWEPIGDPANSHWRVTDGLLVNDAHGANLRSQRKFDDLKVHFEVNCPDGGNSGFYLRGRYEIQIEYEPLSSNPVERRIGSIYGRIARASSSRASPGRGRRSTPPWWAGRSPWSATAQPHRQAGDRRNHRRRARRQRR